MNEFSNVPIDFDSIPTADKIDYNPIEKKHLWVSIIATLIFFAVLFTIFILIKIYADEPPALFTEYFYIVPSVLGVLCIISILLEVLGFRWKGFIIREKDIIYRSGLIFRKQVHVPFNRVQHCEVNQGVLDRYMDLAKLKIFTAGGSRSDLSIPGLKNQTALDLKSFILKKTEEDGSA